MANRFSSSLNLNPTRFIERYNYSCNGIYNSPSPADSFRSVIDQLRITFFSAYTNEVETLSFSLASYSVLSSARIDRFWKTISPISTNRHRTIEKRDTPSPSFLQKKLSLFQVSCFVPSQMERRRLAERKDCILALRYFPQRILRMEEKEQRGRANVGRWLYR